MENEIQKPVVIKLGLFDEHPIILNGLQSYFRTIDGFEVVMTCKNQEQLLTKIGANTPDLLIMDGVFGLESFRQIRASYPQVMLLAFSNLSSRTILESLFAIGVMAFVSKRWEMSVQAMWRNWFAKGLGLDIKWGGAMKCKPETETEWYLTTHKKTTDSRREIIVRL
jgi:DNA-binding NarL/FixJ family response regulator